MGAHGRYVFGSNVLGTGQIGGGGQSTRLDCAARGLTHTVSPTVLMSALGQKQTWGPPLIDVRFTPKSGHRSVRLGKKEAANRGGLERECSIFVR